MAIDHLVHRRPRLLWVALGDTDEWAHRHDYRGYLESLRFADNFVGGLAAHLAAMGDYGAHTAILVTTDHGRDAGFADHGGPASAGVWLMARGGPIARRGSTPLPGSAACATSRRPSPRSSASAGLRAGRAARCWASCLTVTGRLWGCRLR